jgi:hypothetical protein
MPADSLAALERRFYDLATAGGEVDKEDDDFVGTPGQSAAARMQIYADMYLVRLLEALETDFSETRAALGDEAWSDVARAYLRAHPPTSPSLAELGRQFPAFLAGRAPGRPEADLALLEWTRIELFTGPDVGPLDLAAIQALDPEALATLPLALVPTARLLPSGRLVHRGEIHVEDRIVETDELPALTLVAQGTTVGALCELVGDAGVAFGFLSRWLAEHVLHLPT